jgi:hypothetical protein
MTMLRVLVGVARQKSAPAAARVLAANSVLDRGWGKAAQVHASPDGGPIQVVIRQLIETVDQLPMKTIEHEDACDS